MNTTSRIIVLAGLLLLPALLAATEVPYLAGHVNDGAGLLSAETATYLEGMLKAHEDSTSNQVVILTVTSLEGEVLEEFSIRVVESWKLGQKGKDNGVLLLVAHDDRKVRIEVGRGLEGSLTDATSGRIIRNEIIPQFKAGDYNAGIRAGAEAIVGAIQGTYVASDDENTIGDFSARVVAFLLFLGVVGVFTLIALFTKGAGSWFLYLFLIPFWFAFPTTLLGLSPGLILGALYAFGFPIVKFFFAKTTIGKETFSRWTSSGVGRGLSHSWSSGSSSGGSSGSSFSGGGGSFSGGGASGSW